MNKFIHVSFYTNEDQNQEVIIEATKQEFFFGFTKDSEKFTPHVHIGNIRIMLDKYKLTYGEKQRLIESFIDFMATNNNREYFFINSEIDRIVRFSK
jgi:hypothetical protein